MVILCAAADESGVVELFATTVKFQRHHKVHSPLAFTRVDFHAFAKPSIRLACVFPCCSPVVLAACFDRSSSTSPSTSRSPRLTRGSLISCFGQGLLPALEALSARLSPFRFPRMLQSCFMLPVPSCNVLRASSLPTHHSPRSYMYVHVVALCSVQAADNMVVYGDVPGRVGINLARGVVPGRSNWGRTRRRGRLRGRWGRPASGVDPGAAGVDPAAGLTPERTGSSFAMVNPSHFGVNPARWGRPRPDWGQPRGGAPLKVTYSWCRVVLMRATRVVAGRAQSIREPRRSATARIVATDQANAARLASARASRRFGCARVDATDRVDAGAVGSTRAPNRSDTTRINTSASYQHDTARINASAESFRGASR